MINKKISTGNILADVVKCIGKDRRRSNAKIIY
jgi:hypothetical protein